MSGDGAFFKLLDEGIVVVPFAVELCAYIVFLQDGLLVEVCGEDVVDYVELSFG